MTDFFYFRAYIHYKVCKQHEISILTHRFGLSFLDELHATRQGRNPIQADPSR